MYDQSVSTKHRICALSERIGRGVSGFSTALLFALLPLIIVILIDERYSTSPGRTNGSFWTTDFIDLLELFLVMLVVAFSAVYVLRFLYWLKAVIPHYWNRHTPPYESVTQENTNQQHDDIEDLFRQAERKTGLWLLSGILFFFGMIALLLSLSWIINQTGMFAGTEQILEDGPSRDGLLIAVFEAMATLPFLGELMAFIDYLPGDFFLEQMLLNVPAVFFAVAIRNLVFMFEHLDYISREATFRRPNRFAIYLGFGAIANALFSIVIVLLIGVQLAVFG